MVGHLFIECVLFRFLMQLFRHNRLVSSAKWWTFQIFIVWLSLFIYNKNRRGPRTDPRGIPQFIEARPDSYPFMDTY